METKITFSGTVTDQINFAMQQNYIPVFRNLTVKNDSEEKLSGVKVRITFEPEFAKPFESSIADLGPGESFVISPVNIIISSEYLFALTEKIVGSVTICAICGEEEIGSETRSIELLAYDQWTGSAYMPEMLAAFITPNHPKVQEVVAKASLYMQKWCGDPSFTGYQTRSASIVKKQMGAIYAALQEMNIAYIVPPASYETAQRIRMPDTVIEGKSGTCIDLAILYCACLEHIGLYPLLIVVKNHAFAGCWLEEETFADCLQFDSAAIAKRAAKGIDAIALVECTDFVAGKNVDFSESELHAAGRLSSEEDFSFAIDVIRTRASGIRPVPSKVLENGIFTAVDYGQRKAAEITSAPEDLGISGKILLNTSGGEVTKQQIWERKLLDLTLRNSLLSFRPSSSNVQIMAADLSRLEDEIAGGEEFRICPMPEDTMLEAADDKIFRIENDKEHIAAIAENEFASKRLRTFLSPAELEKVMTKLRRQAKVSIEENGANTVYLAVGFLCWYETDKSEKPRYAPLVLIPVDITRRIQDRAFSIKIREEDTQINITLLEMLRHFYGIDIQGLSAMPEDERGVDIPFIFNVVRQAVMANPRWDIKEYAFLGQFSFNRFIMWNDIHTRSGELVNNKVVASLVSGKTEWEGGDISISPVELDTKIPPSEMAVPVAADSSQLAAIYAANAGKSFVLHGPPGTGKSQTITNIIANALYHGKTVLFVAEKMAALEVVEKRLNKIGLAPFCLELHSNKAQKRAVLKQLEDTLAAAHVKSPEQFEEEAQKLSQLRSELNGFMEELHKVRNYGISVYDAAVRSEQNADKGGKFSFSKAQIEAMDSTSYQKWRTELEKLSAAGKDFGDVSKTSLKACRLTECTPDTREKLRSGLIELKERIAAVGESMPLLKDLTGREELYYEQLISVSELIFAAAEEGHLLPEIVSGNEWELRRQSAEKLISSGKEQKNIKSEILNGFESSVLSFDSSGALIKWKTAVSKWFIPKFFETKKLVNELKAYAKDAASVTKENIVQHYEKLNRLAELTGELKNAGGAEAALGALWNGEDSDWELTERSVSLSEKLREMIPVTPFTADEMKTVAERLVSGYGSPSAKDRSRQQTEKLRADISALQSTLSELREKFSVVPETLTGSEKWLTETPAESDRMISELAHLKEWTGIMSVCGTLEEMGIGNVAKSFLAVEIGATELLDAFDCDVNRAMADTSISGSPVLSGFQGVLFEETVRKYGEVLETFRKLTINELVAKLSAKIPAAGASAASSEIGILQKAIRSGGRMMSIRRLFDSIPNLLRRMCPVMLMSPISVAQYIDPSYPKFDYVIFDEASQIQTCNAVGAISRGENAIIVGDPKQLPPTSFFSSNNVDEDNFEKEDLESLLDDCLALSMPQEHLLWHYRSRHESLIAYSNAKYYENKLYTFPSPEDQVSEVSWVHVDGYYDKSSSRTNKAEAKAVVEEIVRRLEDPILRRESIGVVTFSMPQQNLIDDMLTDAFRERPELETWANEQYEPIIIKNLENVQGDERDVIMFSIGYGPDKEGKVSMNFGPLNRDGGWRRLNVAISRAKCRMIVFSVITPEMIDLSRTRSEGVEGLKGFLEFAAKGRESLPVKAGSSVSDSGFAKVIAGELAKRGYTVDCSIGCSDFKVDVAVADPENKKKYILGIFCGTKSSYLNGTAKDRHLSQAEVLSGLGWDTMNVYIIDWLDNKEKVISRIEKAIADSIEKKRHPERSEISSAGNVTEELVFETVDAEPLAVTGEKYEFFEVRSYGVSDDFSEKNTKALRKCAGDILAKEAPINKNTLIKKLASCYGVSRITANVRELADAVLNCPDFKTTGAGEETFLWRSDQQPEQYDKCRCDYNGGEKRGSEEIPPEEIAVGLQRILSAQAGMSRDDLIRETARLFGFSRVTPGIESAVSLGMKEAKRRGYLEFTEDGRVNYIEK